MNVLDEDMFKVIVEVGKLVGSNFIVCCVVLFGEGKCFCVGMDIVNFSLDIKGGIFDEFILSCIYGIVNIF